MTEHGIQESRGISGENFVQLCPALVYQIESGSCAVDSHDDHSDDHKTSASNHIDSAKGRIVIHRVIQIAETLFLKITLIKLIIQLVIAMLCTGN